MKNILILTGTIIASTLSSQGATVFTSSFDDPLAVTSNGATLLGTSAADVEAMQFFGPNNDVVINTVSGQLELTSSTANRFRGAGVWLDAAGFAAGLVTVGVDVTAFSAGADTTISFQAYSANGVNATTGGVSLDLHGGAGVGAVLDSAGGATIATLGDLQEITGTGTAVPFTFEYNGTDQFVGFTFSQSNVNGGTAFGSASLDNLTVDTVPEPSSAVVLGMGLAGLLLRRRR